MKRQSRRTLCAAGLITAALASGAFAQQQERSLVRGCMLSGARRVHPVIVGWSTPNRPLIPSPSMMIPLPHGLGQLRGETGSYWT